MKEKTLKNNRQQIGIMSFDIKSQFYRLFFKIFFIILFYSTQVNAVPLAAVEKTSSEEKTTQVNKIKAAYIFNFLKYVELARSFDHFRNKDSDDIFKMMHLKHDDVCDLFDIYGQMDVDGSGVVSW